MKSWTCPSCGREVTAPDYYGLSLEVRKHLRKHRRVVMA
jgi:hypothetical protein